MTNSVVDNVCCSSKTPAVILTVNSSSLLSFCQCQPIESQKGQRKSLCFVQGLHILTCLQVISNQIQERLSCQKDEHKEKLYARRRIIFLQQWRSCVLIRVRKRREIPVFANIDQLRASLCLQYWIPLTCKSMLKTSCHVQCLLIDLLLT